MALGPPSWLGRVPVAPTVAGGSTGGPSWMVCGVEKTSVSGFYTFRMWASRFFSESAVSFANKAAGVGDRGRGGAEIVIQYVV